MYYPTKSYTDFRFRSLFCYFCRLLLVRLRKIEMLSPVSSQPNICVEHFMIYEMLYYIHH